MFACLMKNILNGTVSALIHTHTHTYACMHCILISHILICWMYAFVYMCVCVCVCVWTIYIYLFLCVHACMCVCMCVCVCVCVYNNNHCQYTCGGYINIHHLRKHEMDQLIISNLSLIFWGLYIYRHIYRCNKQFLKDHSSSLVIDR